MSWVVVAPIILALTAPKKTILFVGVALKLLPVIVTLVPTGPEAGEKELIVGWANTWKEKRNEVKKSKLFFAKIFLSEFVR